MAKNKSYVFSTLAFTCVTFVTGALSWWAPKLLVDALKTMPEEERGMNKDNVAFIFGVVMMMSGIVGVPLGMTLSTQLKAKYPRVDPLVCGGGLMISAVFLLLGLALANQNIFACFAFIFLGSVALNLNWSIIADMLLYIVTPTCRSTAEAIQILASHAFGDAGSPYLIGLVRSKNQQMEFGSFNGVLFVQVSDGLFEFLKTSGTVCVAAAAANATQPLEAETDSLQIAVLGQEDDLEAECTEEIVYKFQSLQYSLFTNFGVEIIGGILFFITAIYIVRDKLACENASAGEIKWT